MGLDQGDGGTNPVPDEDMSAGGAAHPGWLPPAAPIHHPTPRRLPRTRYVHASPQTWSLIRGAYLSGLSAPTVAARFGVSETAIRKRARREGSHRAPATDSGLGAC